MRLISLLLFIVLSSACSSVRKSSTSLQHQVRQSDSFQNDSIGSKLELFISRIKDSSSTMIKVDSSFDRITEETITEKKTDSGEYRETRRTIKEKGQKRTEQTAQRQMYDSSVIHRQEQASLKVLQQSDSTANTIQQAKQVNRKSFLPWWIWLISAGACGLAWWKRNSIFSLFTSKQ